MFFCSLRITQIIEIEQKINRNNLTYKTGDKKDKTYDFQKFKTITSFRREIYNVELNPEEQMRLKNK